MFCSKCGSSNDVEARFCKSCGVQLNENSGAQPIAVSESPEVGYAGFWRRGAALITDMLIIVPVNIVLILLAHSVINDAGKVAALAINNVIGALVGVIYFALQESGTHSATIGKRAFNLKVVRVTNARLSLARAVGRYFARWVSALLLFGYFIQPFTAKRQALHDMVSDSVVVQTKRGGEKLVIAACIGGILLLMLFGMAISILVPKFMAHQENATAIPAHIPEGAVPTRFGLLQVKDNAGKKELLLLPSALIYQEEVDYLSIEQVFKIGDSDAVLISSSCGGSSCTPSYFFVTLQANSKPILSPQFTPNVGEVKPVQKGDTVAIDLGWSDGFQESLVYEAGKISVQRQVSTKKVGADAADCGYLYQEIYLPYVQERWCHTNPGSPMLAASMAQLRGYEALANDSRLNMDFFRKLSQFSCETQQAIAYEQFQQQVCGR